MMKNKIIIIGFTLLLLLNTNIALGNEIFSDNIIYVDADNIYGPWDGSYEYPYKHIQDGINESNNFNTIFIRNGIYSENLKINKEIYLIGEDNTNTIIQSSINIELQFDRIITIYADNVKINNLYIRSNNNNTENKINAIYAENSRELIIQNNHIINCNSAILLDANSSAEILDNHIQFYNKIPLRCIYIINPHQDSVIVISGNNIIM